MTVRKETNAAKQRRYYANPANKQKTIARTIFKSAVQTGKLLRQSCEVCGNKASQGHHDDYSKPLEVRWLCHKHHMAVHFSR